MALSKSAILAADDRKIIPIDVPEWGGQVFLRAMSGKDRDSFENELVNEKQTGRIANMRALLCVRVICDESGARIFDDGDVAALGEKSAPALARVFTAATKLNGIGSEAVAEVGNGSAPVQSAASGSV